MILKLYIRIGMARLLIVAILFWKLRFDDQTDSLKVLLSDLLCRHCVLNTIAFVIFDAKYWFVKIFLVKVVQLVAQLNYETSECNVFHNSNSLIVQSW